MPNTARRAALIDHEPFHNPELADYEQPDYAPVSMLGQCPQHGLEPIVTTRTSGGSDPWELYILACGEIDSEATFGPAGSA